MQTVPVPLRRSRRVIERLQSKEIPPIRIKQQKEKAMENDTLIRETNFVTETEYKQITEKQPFPYSYYSSGELFDLTATSYNNSFGCDKINGALQYGISFPIDKYIKEYQDILNLGFDDKFDKRMERYHFLYSCGNQPYLKKYFTKMCNYLNGGDGIGQYNGQPLIITVAGGNVITIFAQMLYNIHDHVTNGKPLEYINQILLQSDDEIAKIYSVLEHVVNVEQMVTKSYSDFDYNLLPNIMKNFTIAPVNYAALSGFELFRVKSRFECPIQDGKDILLTGYEELNTYKKQCDKSLNIPEELYPQTFQEYMLDGAEVVYDDEPSNPNKNCVKYLEYLKRKKNITQNATDYNVAATVELWRQNLEVILGGDVTKLHAITDYLHTVTSVLNASLANECQFYKSKDMQSWVNHFESLETMLSPNSPLSRMLSVVMGTFLTSDKLHTAEIIPNLNQNNCAVTSSKILRVGNKILKRGNPLLVNSLINSSNTLRKSGPFQKLKSFPKENAFITVNAIITDNNQYDNPEDEVIVTSNPWVGEEQVEPPVGGGKRRTKRRTKRQGKVTKKYIKLKQHKKNRHKSRKNKYILGIHR